MLSARDGGVEEIEELQLLFCRQKRCLEGIAGELTQVFVGEAEVLLGYVVFARQGCAEHGRIVGVERDHEAVIEILLDWMLAGGLARVGGKAEAVIGGISVGIAKKLGRSLRFVAADPDGDYIAVAVADG